MDTLILLLFGSGVQQNLKLPKSFRGCFPLTGVHFEPLLYLAGGRNGRQLSQKRGALARSLQFSGARSSERLPLKKWSNNNNKKHTPSNPTRPSSYSAPAEAHNERADVKSNCDFPTSLDAAVAAHFGGICCSFSWRKAAAAARVEN